jgi:hypothetical protein
MDVRTMAEAFGHPGIDPRQWFAYGIVDDMNDDDPEPSVVFDEDFGPLVKVTLQPTMIPAYCRVAGSIAGNGEGEYHPFVAGDEVLVLIPEGDERGDCAIIGRMNNSIDKFPMDSVGGQDPTTNTFGFKRARTPVVHEYAGPYTLRSALTGALLGFDEAGALTMRDGEGTGFQISADRVGIVSGDGKYQMVLDLLNKYAVLQADDALLMISGTGASPEQNLLNTPGPLAIGAGGQAPGEHAISTEACAHMIQHVLQLITAAMAVITPGPITGAQIATAFSIPVSSASFATGVGNASTTAIVPAVLAAIVGAFAVQPQKTVAPPTGQPLPGIGCQGTLIG